MRRTNTTRSWAAASAAALLLAGCVVAAAGAGAGGGLYFTQRGVESVVPATVERAAATNQAFDQLKVRQMKSQVEQGEDGEKREIEGTAGDREVSVTLKAEGTNATHVQVVAKRTAVTWDKDFARSVLDKIVANSR
ncbi:MAG TPA: DUF3568 family protein [Gemmatimonadales bacterium]|jgi:hypothetical protein|nr:DUF3568 family protein [Gemmatimonadales bacterium]